jgi:hypothetical protein
MNSKKDAAAIKALEELGLRKGPTQVSPEIQDLIDQLDNYDKEIGPADPTTLKQYLIPKNKG